MSIRTERNGTHLTATIHYPETKNAVNFEWMDQIEAILDDLESDAKTRLFILTGSEGSFISGGDLREFHQIKRADEAREMTERMLHILNRIRGLPFWTLAAINGDTYGGGWEIAASFDFRIARSDVNIGFTQGKFYLPPGWGGIASLRQLVPWKTALFWLATQRILPAQEALKSGFVNQVLAPAEYQTGLKKITESLTMNDRTFIEYLKSSASFSGFEQETDPFTRFWESAEHQQRVEAFLNRKKR
ncbi:MAG: enoyl-CoA hydratase/isomerase family protein [Balneolaceae bacterium]